MNTHSIKQRATIAIAQNRLRQRATAKRALSTYVRQRALNEAGSCACGCGEAVNTRDLCAVIPLSGLVFVVGHVS